jgi:hypothetical protein
MCDDVIGTAAHFVISLVCDDFSSVMRANTSQVGIELCSPGDRQDCAALG